MRVGSRILAIAAAGLIFASAFQSGPAEAVSAAPSSLGFTPVPGPAHCDAATINWPAEVDATATMQTGDVATPGRNAFASQTTVPNNNDMIAFNPSGRYLYTVSELSSERLLLV